jgi:uncharacterized membrane protein YphA (DoxX/SURF4 family)
MKNNQWKLIAYWITTILGPASFVIGGTLFFTHAEEPITKLAHLGYPAYLATILGVWKFLGAVAIVIPRFPRLKEWAYAGFFFHLTGAAASHALAGDSLTITAQPLVFLALVIASYVLRPPNRRLSPTNTLHL